MKKRGKQKEKELGNKNKPAYKNTPVYKNASEETDQSATIEVQPKDPLQIYKNVAKSPQPYNSSSHSSSSSSTTNSINRKILAKYGIEMSEELGRGAFGSVYKGVIGERFVAIKIPHSTVFRSF